MKNLYYHGNAPYKVITVHGGPGAYGGMGTVSVELSSRIGVIEAIQTVDSISGQIEELADIITSSAELPVTLIGHSWGAWLTLLTTAKYPHLVRKNILICSAPFEPQYVKEITSTRLSRLSDKEREQAWILKERLKESDLKNRDDIFLEYAHLSCKGDDYHVVPDLYPGKGFSAEIHENVWSEASKMRETGELIELVKQVKCPVLAIHGAYDPHPWKGVDAPLKHILTNFEMVLLPNCGHNPWNEVEARTQFFIELAKAVID